MALVFRDALMRLIAAFLGARFSMPIEGVTQERSGPPPSMPAWSDAFMPTPRRRARIDTAQAAA